MRAINKFLAVSAVALATAAFAGSASAAVRIVASFDTGRSSDNNFDFVNTGGANASVYTISSPGSDVAGAAATRFSFMDDPSLPDFFDMASLFTFNGTVTNTGATFDGSTYTQTGINGSFKFVFNGTTGDYDGHHLVKGVTELFSGTFSDAWIQGNGGVGGIDVTIKNGGSAQYFSTITDLSNYKHEEYSFHLGNVTPNFGVSQSGGALDSFKAHAAGDFQAAIPEPATWALMIMGFGGAGAMLRSQRRRVVA